MLFDKGAYSCNLVRYTVAFSKQFRAGLQSAMENFHFQITKEIRLEKTH